MKRTTLDRSTIDEMDKRHRINFINSLPGFKSLNLVGTVNAQGQSNLSIVSTVTHFGSNPPILGYVSRPDSVERHTLANIKETGHYTFNHINTSIYKQAHQTSARYPREISEFEAVGLTASFLENHKAPFVAESNLSIHLQLADVIDIELNNTRLVLGEITHVCLDTQLIGEDGCIALDAAGTLAGSALDGYHQCQTLARLSYAKPEQSVKEL